MITDPFLDAEAGVDPDEFGARMVGLKPDHDHFFVAPSHRSLWEMIRGGLERNEGVWIITGDSGTGKTLALMRLRNTMGNDRTMVLIDTPTHHPDRFMRMLVEGLDPSFAESESRHLPTQLDLIRILEDRARNKRRVVIAVDDAQFLSGANLEALVRAEQCMISGFKPVQLLLVGRPELQEFMSSHAFQPLLSALVATGEMTPFTFMEIKDYFSFFMNQAGCRQATLTWSGWLELAWFSHGVPQEINRVLRQAIFQSKAGDVCILDGRLIRHVLAEAGQRGYPQGIWRIVPWVAAALVILPLVGFLLGKAVTAMLPSGESPPVGRESSTITGTAPDTPGVSGGPPGKQTLPKHQEIPEDPSQSEWIIPGDGEPATGPPVPTPSPLPNLDVKGNRADERQGAQPVEPNDGKVALPSYAPPSEEENEEEESGNKTPLELEENLGPPVPTPTPLPTSGALSDELRSNQLSTDLTSVPPVRSPEVPTPIKSPAESIPTASGNLMSTVNPATQPGGIVPIPRLPTSGNLLPTINPATQPGGIIPIPRMPPVSVPPPPQLPSQIAPNTANPPGPAAPAKTVASRRKPVNEEIEATPPPTPLNPFGRAIQPIPEELPMVPATGGATSSPPASVDVTDRPYAPASLQLGSYKSQENADRVVKRMVDKGYRAYLFTSRRDDTLFYTVRIDFPSQQEALKAKEEINRQEQLPSLIIKRTP